MLSLIREKMQITSIEYIWLLLSRLCEVTQNHVEKIHSVCELKFEWLGKDGCQFVGLLDWLVVETGGKQRLHNIIINGVNRLNQCER